MNLQRPHWSTPALPASPEAPVEVWRLRLSDLGDAPMERLHALTVPEEHDRAQCYRHEDDRHRHLAGRAVLRAVLSRRYGCKPRTLSIAVDEHGKPIVNQMIGGEEPPQVNIAHAADVVLVALSVEHPVGIDVEALDRDTDPVALADRVLTDTEQQHLQSLPNADQSQFFIHVWTCKEAFLKATGTGLRRDTTSIECRVEKDTVVGIRDLRENGPVATKEPTSHWGLRVFRAEENVAGAVVRQHDMPPSLLFADGSSLVRHFSSS